MKRLTQTDPFKIVSSESSSASEIREATDELIEMILELSNSATDDTTLFRIMNYTRFILEKPRDFDPFGHAGLSPLATI